MSAPAHVCPAGHPSDDADFCDVCGRAMAPAALTGGVPASCPECGTPATGRFCEVCGFDLVTGCPAEPLAGAVPADPAAAAAPDPVGGAPTSDPVGGAPAGDPAGGARVATPAPAVAPAGWELTVASASADLEYLFPLAGEEALIGRGDPANGIRPAIVVRDTDVSRQHARLIRGATGAYAIADLGSANGTTVNGEQLDPGPARVLRDGDVILLGDSTRLTIRRHG